MASREKNRELMLGKVIPERIKRQNRLQAAESGKAKKIFVRPNLATNPPIHDGVSANLRSVHRYEQSR